MTLWCLEVWGSRRFFLFLFQYSRKCLSGFQFPGLDSRKGLTLLQRGFNPLKGLKCYHQLIFCIRFAVKLQDIFETY